MENSTMKLGVQLYGCMDIFRENPDEFFAELKSMGYTQAEPCIALGISAEEIKAAGIKPVWQPEEVKDFKAMMATHDLTLSSAHIFGNPLEHLEALKKMVAENKIEQIVLNCPRDLSAESCQSFAEMCAKLSDELKAIGAELWLHNSFAEVREQIDGTSAYEFILNKTEGKLCAQVDVGWVLYGGEDPVTFMKKIKTSIASIHYKDLKHGYESMPPQDTNCALGTGALNLHSITKFCKSMDITQLIDQDKSDGSFLEDLKVSAEAMKSAQ